MSGRGKIAAALVAVMTLAGTAAWGQSTGSTAGPITLAPGAQNPATAQPQLVAPPPAGQLSQPARPMAQPAAVQPAPQPATPAGPSSPASLIIPDGAAGGLCECLINHDPNVSPFDKTKMHQGCLGSVEACQSACNTDHYYSFVPHAIYTCPGQPSGPGNGHIAQNSRPVTRRLLASR